MAMITTTIAEPLLSVRLWNCLTLENILGFLPHTFIFLVFLPVSSLSCCLSDHSITVPVMVSTGDCTPIVSLLYTCTRMS